MSVRQDIENALRELRTHKDETISTAHVIAMVEGLLRSIATGKEDQRHAMVEELQTMMMHITNMREEISALNPGQLKAEAIPSAQDELDAVVAHTEEATNKILDAAEKIQTLAGSLPEDSQTGITDQTMIIFEASNFQDITGQRISKVVNTLKNVETALVKMLKFLGFSESDLKPAEKIIQSDADLLNGPQLPNKANSQDDIDAILAAFD